MPIARVRIVWRYVGTCWRNKNRINLGHIGWSKSEEFREDCYYYNNYYSKKFFVRFKRRIYYCYQLKFYYNFDLDTCRKVRPLVAQINIPIDVAIEILSVSLLEMRILIFLMFWRLIFLFPFIHFARITNSDRHDCIYT